MRGACILWQALLKVYCLLVKVVGPCEGRHALPGGVIVVPINAPDMGRFKLFDLVGYS